MADQRSRLQMDILARVAGIQEVQRLAAAVDETGDEMRTAAGDAALLEQAIDEVSDEIAELNRELLRTGDVNVFEKIKADRSTLGMLRRMRRELGDIGDDGDRAGRGFVSALGDTFAAIPPRLRGALIAGVAGAAVSLSPLLGAAIGGAVLGGVGAGGIVGGIVSAARDTRVQGAAQDLVSQVEKPFTRIGEAFIDPLRDSLNSLARDASGFLGDLGPEIRGLAPDVRALAAGFGDMLDQLGPGIGDALEAAGPVLRAIANELPELGDAFSDMFSTIAEESDGAILGLTTILRLSSDLIRGVGEVVAFLSRVFEGVLNIELAVVSFAERASEHIPFVSNLFGQSREGIEDLKASLLAAGDEGGNAGEEIGLGFLFAGEQINATNAILQRHQDLLRAQTDPMFALIEAQNRNAEAQTAYTDAVKEHGRNSPEAEAALLAQAQAALALQGAVGEAAGVFDGKFSPSQRAALIAAGFTKDELKRLEDQFDEARRAGERASKDYFLNINVTTKYRTEGKPPPGMFGLGQLSTSAGPATAFQHGGMVFGPGGIDRVPAMLTAGEFVVRRQQAQRHIELLQAINTGSGAVPSGGAVRGGDSPEVVEVQVFIGDRELTDIVDVRIAHRDRGTVRRVDQGSGRAG